MRENIKRNKKMARANCPQLHKRSNTGEALAFEEGNVLIAYFISIFGIALF